MTINSSGVWCDGCDDSISAAAFVAEAFAQPEPGYRELKLTSSDYIWHICDKCHPIVEKAIEASDWNMLPDGLLLRTYRRANNDGSNGRS